MKKPYLLIGGPCYYPSGDTNDWIGCFETYEEAQQKVEVIKQHIYYTKGENKGEIKTTYERYVINCGDYDKNCDWYEIVDLRDWAE